MNSISQKLDQGSCREEDGVDVACVQLVCRSLLFTVVTSGDERSSILMIYINHG